MDYLCNFKSIAGCNLYIPYIPKPGSFLIYGTIHDIVIHDFTISEIFNDILKSLKIMIKHLRKKITIITDIDRKQYYGDFLNTIVKYIDDLPIEWNYWQFPAMEVWYKSVSAFECDLHRNIQEAHYIRELISISVEFMPSKVTQKLYKIYHKLTQTSQLRKKYDLYCIKNMPDNNNELDKDCSDQLENIQRINIEKDYDDDDDEELDIDNEVDDEFQYNDIERNCGGTRMSNY
jgi:hypothetical protein